MQFAQARLLRNTEYQLQDQWVKVPQGTIINFCDETQSAYVANENELFHCDPEHAELITTPIFSLVPPVEEMQIPMFK